MNSNHKVDLVLKGDVVSSEKVLPNAYVAIKDEKIYAVLADIEGISYDNYKDFSGCYLLPGCIDAHVHSYSFLNEGFENATKAAVSGGVTTIIEMPYDASGIVADKETFQHKKNLIARNAYSDVAMLGTIQKGKKLHEEIKDLAKEGACGFKVSMFNTNPTRFPRIDDGELYDVFCEINQTGLTVGLHAENDELVNRFIPKYIENGKDDPIYHCLSRPPVCETAAVALALELAYNAGNRIHIYHASLSRTFDLLDYYKSLGVNATAETCPNYLLFSADDMAHYAGKAKINPPIRDYTEMKKLEQYLLAGKVDFITSDHAPLQIDRKINPNIFDNGSGTPGVETLLPIIYSEFVATDKLSIMQLVALLAENPAKTFNICHKKGFIKEGFDADLVVLDPKQQYTLDEKDLYSTAGWSLFHNRLVQGKITHTFLRGKLSYNGNILTSQGVGQFVPALANNK